MYENFSRSWGGWEGGWGLEREEGGLGVEELGGVDSGEGRVRG